MNLKSVKVNLTITGEVDRRVSEYARAAGLSKSAAVAAWLILTLPEMSDWVRRVKQAEQGPGTGRGEAVSGGRGVGNGVARPKPAAARKAPRRVPLGTPVTRRERRELERERVKQRKG